MLSLLLCKSHKWALLNVDLSTCYHGIGPAQTLREKFNVDAESPVKTACCHVWCHPCVLSSELGFIENCKQAGIQTGPQRQVMIVQTVPMPVQSTGVAPAQ